MFSVSFRMANLRNLAFWLIVALWSTAGTTVASFAQDQRPSPAAITSPTLVEKGLPYLRNYTSKEYGAFMQNWAVLQDQQGVM